MSIPRYIEIQNMHAISILLNSFEWLIIYVYVVYISNDSVVVHFLSHLCCCIIIAISHSHSGSSQWMYTNNDLLTSTNEPHAICHIVIELKAESNFSLVVYLHVKFISFCLVHRWHSLSPSPLQSLSSSLSLPLPLLPLSLFLSFRRRV